MSRSFNLENVQRLKRAVENLEQIPGVAQKGVDNTLELAKRTGAPKFLKACEGLAEKFEGLKASTADLVDVNSRIQKKYAALEQSL